MKKKHKKKTYAIQCNHCDKVAVNLTGMISHLKAAHDQEDIWHGDDYEYTRRKPNMGKRRTKKATLTIDCPRCGRDFKKRTQLQAHHNRTKGMCGQKSRTELEKVRRENQRRRTKKNTPAEGEVVYIPYMVELDFRTMQITRISYDEGIRRERNLRRAQNLK